MGARFLAIEKYSRKNHTWLQNVSQFYGVHLNGLLSLSDIPDDLPEGRPLAVHEEECPEHLGGKPHSQCNRTRQDNKAQRYLPGRDSM